MKAIFKKEFASYFYTPLGYIYLAIFYIFVGLDLYMSSLKTMYVDTSGVFRGSMLVSTLLIPLLTMRLFSRERKDKTDQLIMTAPVTPLQIVLGKYFAAVCMYLIAISIHLAYNFIFSFYATIDFGVVFSSFLGLLIMGLSLIAIGMFISLLTKSQMIAGVLTVALSIFLSRSDFLGSIIKFEWVQKIFYNISFFEKYFAFTQGVITLPNVFFFLSLTVLFIYLSIYRLSNQKYRN